MKTTNLEKHLSEFVKMGSRIAIYVPTTINVDQTYETSKQVEDTLRFLSSKFGGSTAFKAQGAWAEGYDKAIVREDITICVAYTTEIKLDQSIKDLKIYCQSLKHELQQSAIGVEIQDAFYLI